MKKQFTSPTINLLLGLIGLLIIWLGTHSFVGLLGGIIAGLHINFNID